MADNGAIMGLPPTGLGTPGRSGRRMGQAGVRVRVIAGADVVTIVALRGETRALADRIEHAFGVKLPESPSRGESGNVSFTWSGPGRWFAMRSGTVGASLEEELKPVCAPLAAIVDQSHSFGVLHLSGPKIREALAKGFTIDLHPQIFWTSHTAMTAVSHIAAQITRIADEPVFEVIFPRSYAASFWHWLEASAAEFGLEVQGSGEAAVS